jgi:hypothetical protein
VPPVASADLSEETAPLPTVNIVAGILDAAALPFVALVTAYVYFDARTRVELEPAVEHRTLPAEIEFLT